MKRNAPGCQCTQGYLAVFGRPTNLILICPATSNVGQTISIALSDYFGAGAVGVGVDIERKRALVQKPNGEIWTLDLEGQIELLWDSSSDIGGVYPVVIKYHHSWGYASCCLAGSNYSDRILSFDIGNNFYVPLDADGDFIIAPFSPSVSEGGVLDHCVSDVGNIYTKGRIDTINNAPNDWTRKEYIYENNSDYGYALFPFTTTGFIQSDKEGLSLGVSDIFCTGTDVYAGVTIYPQTQPKPLLGIAPALGEFAVADVLMTSEDISPIYPSDYAISDEPLYSYRYMIYDDLEDTIDLTSSKLAHKVGQTDQSFTGAVRINTSLSYNSILLSERLLSRDFNYNPAWWVIR